MCGVAPELNDSAVQQFVNSKTNRPVAFAVEHAEYEGAQLTIIRIAQKQSDQYFLTRATADSRYPICGNLCNLWMK